MLRVDSDEVQVELGGSLVLALEDDLEMGGVLISLESDAVVVVSQLHDLGKVSDGDAKHHVGISAVVLKAVHGKVQGHQGNVRGVHGLKGETYKKNKLILNAMRKRDE